MGAVARVAGLVIAGVALVIALASAAIYVFSELRLNQKVNVAPEAVTVPTDIASVQYGQHLASAVAMCTRCHGQNLAGRVVTDNRSLRVAAPNLTRGTGGIGNVRSDADLARAIRHGVDPGGRLLWTMPSDNYIRVSATDMGALIAFIRSLPAVPADLPERELRPLGRVLLATGQLPLLPGADIDREAPRLPAPAPGVTPEYGAYLVELAGCYSCHGTALAGGGVSSSPPAPNITRTGIGDWSDADFLRAMRSGRRPDGSTLDSSMPWQYFAQMSELELRAIWRYLQALPPRI